MSASELDASVRHADVIGLVDGEGDERSEMKVVRILCGLARTSQRCIPALD